MKERRPRAPAVERGQGENEGEVLGAEARAHPAAQDEQELPKEVRRFLDFLVEMAVRSWDR
jgi:hypothetical protein